MQALRRCVSNTRYEYYRNAGGDLTSQSHHLQGMSAYKNPVAKIAVMSIFFFNGKRSLQTQGIGSMRIVKSDMTLKIPVPWKVALTL